MAIRFQPRSAPGQRDTFGQQHLIAASALGGLGDRPQAGEVSHLCDLRVQRVRERLEPARHLVDLGASVQMAKIMAKRYMGMARQIQNATFTLVNRGSRP